MQAPKYVESNKDVLRYRDYSLQLHQQKLQRIKDRNNRLDLSPSVMEKAAGQRLKTVGFLEAERQESIRRENEVLMAKLLSITEPKGNKRGVKSLEHRSLNTHQRKKEVERIRTENEAFSKRLQEKAAMLSKKRMDLDYIESQKYKRQISKAHLLKRQGRKVQLPPLQEAPVDLRVSSSQNALESSPSNQPRRSAHKQADEGLNKTYHYSLTVSHRDKSPRQKIGMTLDKSEAGDDRADKCHGIDNHKGGLSTTRQVDGNDGVEESCK